MLFVLVFAISAHGFISQVNMYSISRSIAINGVIEPAMMTVLVTGGLNLALGAVAVCSAMVVGWSLQNLGLGIAPALLLGVPSGATLRAVNGLIVVTTRLAVLLLLLYVCRFTELGAQRGGGRASNR